MPVKNVVTFATFLLCAKNFTVAEMFSFYIISGDRGSGIRLTQVLKIVKL